MHQPRDYQSQLENDCYTAWNNGARNVLAVLPTGGGKTFVFSRVANAMNTAVCAIAHRSELVGQMSLALAREGVRHRVIGPDAVRRDCVQRHMEDEDVGRSFFDDSARVAVAGVDTLVNYNANDPWCAQVGLWIQDEAHHVLKDNKWGKAAQLFPNARGMGVTATPLRADGKGLGRNADGLFDSLIEGPPMRELINRGFLTEYRVFCPPSDIDLARVRITDSGDYSPPQLKAARRASHITGDVVTHYLRLARGKLGVTFDTDIDSATETAAAYNAAGVPAEVVTSKTPQGLRASILRRFKQRQVLQLVNVDLFGEGFDLPAIEVVSMARPTMSYGLYCQQFGRALRIMDGKPWAIIIDHVGNVMKHGLPDAKREWTLDRRERRGRSGPTDAIPVRACLNPECMSAYERVLDACPYCGHAPVPPDRSGPERVDGNLLELDPAVLRAMRGEVARIDGGVPMPRGLSGPALAHLQHMHSARQQAQNELRSSINLWAGWQRSMGRSDSESYRRFFYLFGTDVGSAVALGAREAQDLRTLIDNNLRRHGVQQQ